MNPNAAPDLAPPPAPYRVLIKFPLRVRRLHVHALTPVTPRLMRVTLTGDELSGFASEAPDDHVKVLLPAPGRAEPELPSVVGGRVLWPQDRSGFVARDYTPVRFDPGARQLDLELVVHTGGHASQWLASAQVGSVVGVAGPRGSHVFARIPQQLLLVGDETALPAIARWLRELPSSVCVRALIEVHDAQERRALPTAADLTVSWLERGGRAAGTTTLLEDALRALPGLDPSTYVWLAGEAGAVQACRRLSAEVWQIPRAQLDTRGYWKRGTVDHQEPHSD